MHARIRRRRPRRVAAFTLVELLVVIGIIALLIAILLPSLARARHQAQLTTCMARLHDFAGSMVSYAAENRGYFPRHDITMATGRNTHDVSNRFYQILRTQFRRPHQTFFCPTTPDEYASEKFAFTYVTTDLNSPNGFVMIGYAVWVPRSNGGLMMPPAPGAGFLVYDPTELTRGPVRIGEKLANRTPIVTDLVLTTYIHLPPVVNDLSRDGGLTWRWFSGHQVKGKLESANEAYADGHVERVPGAKIQPRYNGGRNGFDSWNWR